MVSRQEANRRAVSKIHQEGGTVTHRWLGRGKARASSKEIAAARKKRR